MLDNIDALVGKITELADALAAPAAQAAVEAARVEAIRTIAGGGMNVAVALLCLWVGRKLWAARETGYDEFPFKAVGAALLFIVAIIAALMGVWSLIDPWTWTTLTHPELWLAKRLLRL